VPHQARRAIADAAQIGNEWNAQAFPRPEPKLRVNFLRVRRERLAVRVLTSTTFYPARRSEALMRGFVARIAVRCAMLAVFVAWRRPTVRRHGRARIGIRRRGQVRRRGRRVRRINCAAIMLAAPKQSDQRQGAHKGRAPSRSCARSRWSCRPHAVSPPASGRAGIRFRGREGIPGARCTRNPVA
jgi:hypothetical protein